MQEPFTVSDTEKTLPPNEMESSEKTWTEQEPPPNQVQDLPPSYPTSTPSVPPSNLTHTAYSTTMPGGQPPAMYQPAYPTTQVVAAQPPGTYAPYYTNIPANMTQQQPGYNTTMAPQPQPPLTNLPPYPGTVPGTHLQFNSQAAYPNQQQYPVYQNTTASNFPAQQPGVAWSMPKDYLCWSIMSMLCCFCPIGLAAVIFSSQVQNAVTQQDWAKARRYSNTACILNVLALVLGVILYIVLIILRAT